MQGICFACHEASKAPMEKYHLGRSKRPSKLHGQTLFATWRMKHPLNWTRRSSGTATAMTICPMMSEWWRTKSPQKEIVAERQMKVSTS